jgi:CRP-like cAMP-binding protein
MNIATMQLKGPGVGYPVEQMLASYAPLKPEDAEVINSALSDVRGHTTGRPIGASTGAGERPSRIVLSGWITWSASFPDGRRQIVSVALPGDLLDVSPAADLGVTHAPLGPALTADARALIAAVERTPGSALSEAWRRARKAAEARQVRQILRLGQLSAYERTACFMLELHDRQRRVGLADETSMPLPLTQETLAEILGLSVVHMNRVLQQHRREGLIEFSTGRVFLPNLEGLALAALRV